MEAEGDAAPDGMPEVTVLLPARNEEATVGAIVSTIREHLMDRVPFFVILPPGSRPPEGSPLAVVHEVPAIGGHVDIAPTLLHLLGIREPASFVGESLLPEGERRYSAHPDGSAESHPVRAGHVVQRLRGRARRSRKTTAVGSVSS